MFAFHLWHILHWKAFSASWNTFLEASNRQRR